MRLTTIAFAGLLLAGRSHFAVAQTHGPRFAGPSAQTLEATAALQPLAFSNASSSPALATVAVRSVHGGNGKAVALMIVGAAGIITGLAVDEDIITIAGAAAAGIGLYLYLR